MKPARRRDIATWIRERFQATTKRACRLARLRRSTWYYRRVAKDQSALGHFSRPPFGYERIHMPLRCEGMEGGSQLRVQAVLPGGTASSDARTAAQWVSLHPGPVPAPMSTNESRSMVFVHDRLQKQKVSGADRDR